MHTHLVSFDQIDCTTAIHKGRIADNPASISQVDYSGKFGNSTSIPFPRTTGVTLVLEEIMG